MRRRITVQQGCGIEAVASYAARRDVFVYGDPPYNTAGTRMYVHGGVDMSALLAGCLQARGPVVLSYADDVQVVNQAQALGFDVIAQCMLSGRNVPQREVLISNRPLPHEPLQVKDEGPA
jgi:hypothetical protein